MSVCIRVTTLFYIHIYICMYVVRLDFVLRLHYLLLRRDYKLFIHRTKVYWHFVRKHLAVSLLVMTFYIDQSIYVKTERKKS